MIASAGSGGTSLFLIEGAATAICTAVALCVPRVPTAWPGKALSRTVGYALTKLARKRALCVFLVGACAFTLRLLILPLSPIPKPFILGDFSFLLAADTFSLGRLTNPPHPMWTHFESFHITVSPTYMSMYFPAQGMVLAAAMIVAGNPWFGVLASTALMCAAVCWMLQAWLPPKWALLGGLIAILRIGLFSYWIDTYVGGSVAACGGALVMGAIPRIWRNFRARDAFWLALGMAVLANSRPYEGLLLSAPALAYLCWKISRSRHPSISTMLLRSVPAILLLLGTAAFMGYYNYRVFGNVFTPPYKVNRDMYASAPHFLWQSLRPEPVYRHEAMRDFYSNWERGEFLKTRTLPGLLETTALKAVTAQLFFLGFVLLLPMAMLPFALRDKRIRVLTVIAAVSICGLAAETWLIPHYMAPLTAVLYAILLQCMRHMRTWRFDGRRTGVFLVRAIPAVCALLCVVRLYAEPLHLVLAPAKFSSRAWFGTLPFGLDRARVMSDLERRPGKQLAIVRYSPGHDAMNEWVYNAADIDGAKVVWARYMNPAENTTLIRYFSDRTAWLIEPDSTPPIVRPFEPQLKASAGNSRN